MQRSKPSRQVQAADQARAAAQTLAMLRRDGLLREWSDHEIMVGDKLGMWCDRPVLTDGILPRIAAVAGGSVLDEKDLPTCGRNLQAQSSEVGVPPDDILGGGGKGIDLALD